MKELRADLRTTPPALSRRRAQRWLISGLSAVACAASFNPGAASDMQVVEDLRPLLVQAIDSFDGSAKGILGGSLAKVLRVRMISTEPLQVHVTTLQDLR